MKEVGRVLTAQADHPKVLFGSMAVELGLCTEADINDVIAAQKKRCPHVLDLALADERVNSEKLMVAVKAYIRHAEEMLARLDDAVLESGLC